MRIVIINGIDGVSWAIVDELGGFLAYSHENHLTESEAKEEAGQILSVLLASADSIEVLQE